MRSWAKAMAVSLLSQWWPGIPFTDFQSLSRIASSYLSSCLLDSVPKPCSCLSPSHRVLFSTNCLVQEDNVVYFLQNFTASFIIYGNMTCYTHNCKSMYTCRKADQPRKRLEPSYQTYRFRSMHNQTVLLILLNHHNFIYIRYQSNANMAHNKFPLLFVQLSQLLKRLELVCLHFRGLQCIFSYMFSRNLILALGYAWCICIWMKVNKNEAS